MRLAIGREGIEIELAQPVRLGCLIVTQVTASLPGMRFPIDVSGGVPRFRHRRGVLQRVELDVDVRALERWAAPRLRGILGTRAPEVWVRARPAGATVCVAAARDVDEGSEGAWPIVAFEVCALAGDDDLSFIVERARGSDLPAAATATAIACVEALFGHLADRAGAIFAVPRPARVIARSLFPRAGARVPATECLRWTSIAADGNCWILHASRGALSAMPSEEALRAREVATLLRETDDALVGGDEAGARSSCLEALERAPGHAEITRRLIEIDARAGGRCEAALATLSSAPYTEGAVSLGTIPGEMLLAVGDMAAAVASFERAGDTEPAPALAARAFELGARATSDAERAARLLDLAIARAPRSISARWERVARRLELGRLEDALADVEHLEALANGSRVKAAVWMRAGEAWRRKGHAARARPHFERALHYAPDEAGALAGLGAALVGGGSAARGIAVLARALEIAGAGVEPSSSIRLDLARALAEHLDDLPTAIAHASAIPSEAKEAPAARGLEGRWRARLGDRAGAALSFARLRELAATLGPSTDEARLSTTTALLLEAADFERTGTPDLMSAQRHVATALRLRPHDAGLLRAYRELGALVAQAGSHHEGPVPALAHGAPSPRRPAANAPREAPRVEGVDDETHAAARVDELTRQLQANPRDEAVSDELASWLELLGRGHELLALLSAGIEEGAPERKGELVQRARAAMARLASKAEDAGRTEDAAFCRDAMTLLA